MENATIPNNPIDLPRDIRELLETISKGRDKLRGPEAGDIFEAWRDANERWDLACNQLTELAGCPSASREEIALQNEAKKELGREHAESWHRVQELRSFIDRFGVNVEVLLSRLPNRRRWVRFPKLIRGLRFRSVDDWIQPNTDLDTLEMRLGDMLELLPNPRTDAGQRQTPPSAKGRLSLRDSEIESVIIQKFGDHWSEHHDNAEIIRKALRDVGEKLREPSLNGSRLRASLNRIRKARGHRSSESIRKQLSSKN